MTKHLPTTARPDLNWRIIWGVLHRRQYDLITREEAMTVLKAQNLTELEAAALLYVNARDGYQLKRYF